MTYTLDTNACIGFLRGKHPRLQQRVLSHFNDIAITPVVVAELYYGVEPSSNPAANRALTDTFLAPFPLLAFDRAAVAYGDIRANLAKRGQLIGPNDFLIAAIARSSGVILVTHNTREFSRVDGLSLEDWEL